MSEHQQLLFNKLWAIANTLRGTMDASEFKNYMLGFIFYKHLSEKIEKFVNKELEADKISFEEAFKNSEIREALQEESV
ncbi:MAG: type I restriction-modification system subunit M N-terminal domain-containing protein, partial [Fusobacteriaceae bacterium]|nr:type I restriction-modification system subunit M N-terminal domain-containing protein [Fusobacteriaceae bacterium]